MMAQEPDDFAEMIEDAGRSAFRLGLILAGVIGAALFCVGVLVGRWTV